LALMRVSMLESIAPFMVYGKNDEINLKWN
jgi:hypothetical protein